MFKVIFSSVLLCVGAISTADLSAAKWNFSLNLVSPLVCQPAPVIVCPPTRRVVYEVAPVAVPCHCCHDCDLAIRDTYDRGALVQLNDGTLWDVAPYAQGRTKHWRECDSIELSRSNDCRYPYLLTNYSSRESAPVSAK